MEVSCLAEEVAIRFCEGLREEEVFIDSLEGILKFW